jgi:hypothetical protein
VLGAWPPLGLSTICLSFRVIVRLESQASQDNLGPRVSR